MTKKNASSSSSLDKLLQRLSRHFSSSSAARPPDAASDKLGREVARCAVSASDLELVYKSLLRAAESSRLPPSVPYAILEEITHRMKGDMVLHNFEFLTEWLLQTEHLYSQKQQMHHETSTTVGSAPQQQLRHLLTACI